MIPEAVAPLLRFAWTATLLFLLLALSVTLVLVLRRLVGELAAPRRARALAAMHRHLLEAALGRRDPAAVPPGPYPPREAVAELVVELAAMGRGEMRRRLAAAAKALGVLDHLLARSRSRRAALRARAARRLGLFAPVAPRAVRAALARLLDDPAGEVRVAAAETAAGLDGEARRAVADRIRRDPVFTRRLALPCLERLGGADPALLDSLAEGADAARLARLLEAAGRARLLPLAPRALAALRHPAVAVRLAAARALVEMEHPRAAAALAELAADADPALRLEALLLMAERPRAPYLRILRARLDDPDPGVAFRAHHLLARLAPAAEVPA